MAAELKLTPEVSDRIISLLRAGNFLETAAAAAGVSSRVIRMWLSKGAQDDDGIYHQFAEDVRKAYAEAEAIALAIVNKAAQAGEWRAIAWRLEKTRPDKYGAKVQVEHTVRQELAEELLERLREKLDANTFRKVAAVLMEDGGDESIGSCDSTH